MNTAIIVPSRHRPHNIKELQQSLIDTHTMSRLFVVVDEDDETLDQYLSLENNFTEVLTFKRGRKGMADPLNNALVAPREQLDGPKRVASLEPGRAVCRLDPRPSKAVGRVRSQSSTHGRGPAASARCTCRAP